MKSAEQRDPPRTVEAYRTRGSNRKAGRALRSRRGKGRPGQGRNLPEYIQITALELLRPEELERHLWMNATRLVEYPLLRAEVVLYGRPARETR